MPVGRWVLDTACEQGAKWARDGHPMMISVNISAKQLETVHLVDDVHEALATSGLDPGLLILELTETALMSDVDTTVEQLLLLKARGVRIAIDDFGTGYSSFAYLSQFPLSSMARQSPPLSSMASPPF